MDLTFLSFFRAYYQHHIGKRVNLQENHGVRHQMWLVMEDHNPSSIVAMGQNPSINTRVNTKISGVWMFTNHLYTIITIIYHYSPVLTTTIILPILPLWHSLSLLLGIDLLTQVKSGSHSPYLSDFIATSKCFPNVSISYQLH